MFNWGRGTWKLNLKPQSSSFLKERNECAINVGVQEGLDPTKELAADEDGGDGLNGAGHLAQDTMDGLAGGVLVDLDDGGANAEAEEEALGHRGHAAVAGTEDHHGLAGCQLLHHLKRVHLHLLSCCWWRRRWWRHWWQWWWWWCWCLHLNGLFHHLLLRNGCIGAK